MREARALIRSAWLTASSYRVGMAMSLLGLAAVLLPLYFIAHALEPTMQQAIKAESRQYFAFVVVGATMFSLISTCVTALPSALDGAIARGTFEMILGTPARLRSICVGMMGYGVLWGLLRAAIVIAAAGLLGARITWTGVPAGALVVALTMLSYVGVGLILASLVLTFRTTGPLSAAILTGSMFLGGVYYPTHVIPSWIHDVSAFLPLTYGLRALRQIVLLGDSLGMVWRDVIMLLAIAAATLLAGSAALSLALRRARRTGTLYSY